MDNDYISEIINLFKNKSFRVSLREYNINKYSYFYVEKENNRYTVKIYWRYSLYKNRRDMVNSLIRNAVRTNSNGIYAVFQQKIDSSFIDYLSGLGIGIIIGNEFYRETKDIEYILERFIDTEKEEYPIRRSNVWMAYMFGFTQREKQEITNIIEITELKNLPANIVIFLIISAVLSATFGNLIDYTYSFYIFLITIFLISLYTLNVMRKIDGYNNK